MRRTVSFVTADVFTSVPFAGNPVAVIPDGRDLDGERMQAIANEFNLSETTFVLPPASPDHDARVRISDRWSQEPSAAPSTHPRGKSLLR